MRSGLGSSWICHTHFGVISISMGIAVGNSCESSISPGKRPRPGNPRPGIDPRGSISPSPHAARLLGHSPRPEWLHDGNACPRGGLDGVGPHVGTTT